MEWRWLRGKTNERQLDRELRFHMERQIQDYVAAGLPPEEAQRRTRLEFGGLEQIKDDCRDVRPSAWLEDLWRDARFAVRHLGANWRVAITSVVTLGLAIGASTLVFGVLHALFLQALPYREAGRLAVLWTNDAKRNVASEGVSVPNFRDWQVMSRSFEAMALFGRGSSVGAALTDGAVTERVRKTSVAAGFFPLLGVAPVRGRWFSEEEQLRGAPVVVIGERLWTRRYGRSESLVGGSIEVGGKPVMVVGVMPAAFRFPSWEDELWTPIVATNRDTDRYFDPFGVLVRLKPGVSIAAARKDMDAVGQVLADRHADAPADFAGFGVTVLSLLDHLYGSDLQRGLWMAFAAVLLLLLIACSNVGSLLLAQATARRQEFTIRAALGAGGSRLFRQLLSESGVIAMASLVFGIGVAFAGWRMAIAVFGEDAPALTQSGMHFDVLAFAFATTAITTLVCGTAPAWRAKRETLRGARVTSDRGTRRFLHALVVVQVMLAMLLCAGAGLLGRSFVHLHATSLGYLPDQLLSFTLALRTHGDASDEAADRRWLQTTRAICERLESLPGVNGVAAATDFFIKRNPDMEVEVNGVKRSDIPLTDDMITASYVRVAGARLLRGRTFTAEEEEQKRGVAIINRTMAERFWPGEEALGRSFRRGRSQKVVVGVIEDMRLRGREREPVAQMFYPMGPFYAPTILVRATADPQQLHAAIRSEVANLDPTASVLHLAPVNRMLDTYEAPRRIHTWFAAAFSVLALAMALSGVYAVLGYISERRRKEFGIRLSVGASPRDLALRVFRNATQLAGAGIALGFVAALLCAGWLRSLLYGVSPVDPITFAGCALLLLAVLWIGSIAPAWRAARVSAVESLRRE